MSNFVIKAEGLGKRFTIGHQTENESYKTIRDLMAQSTRALFGKTRDLIKGKPTSKRETLEEFWALQDINFEIKPGERVGIIGRNGAGKSTLLKVISRITEPSAGSVILKGRVSSLLEVGTGFHPELSGRENIFLNGAILGMSRSEVLRKFDEIVAFAEVERFLDTPVKRFSSGMYVRLAFAVAAHLEPEILVVDEVIAVGDASFQKKCLGRLEDVSKEGRTVIFVSHNMGALLGLCSRAVLLNHGKIQMDGPAQDVVRQYIESGKENSGECVWNEASKSPGNGKLRLNAVRFIVDNNITADIDIDKEIQIEIEFWNLKNGTEVSTSIHLLDQMGTCVLASANMHSANSGYDHWYGKPHPCGLFKTVCKIPANFLNEGRYSINVIVLTNQTNTEIFEKDVLSFHVHETGAMRKEYAGLWIGVVRPKLEWATELSQKGLEGFTA